MRRVAACTALRAGAFLATALAAGLAAGLAVGLALQNTLQNIAAGIMLLMLRPLRAGEFVSVVGKGDGTVQEVGLFLTHFEQVDGIQFMVSHDSSGAPRIHQFAHPADRVFEADEHRLADQVVADVELGQLRDGSNRLDVFIGKPMPGVGFDAVLHGQRRHVGNAPQALAACRNTALTLLRRMGLRIVEGFEHFADFAKKRMPAGGAAPGG